MSFMHKLSFSKLFIHLARSRFFFRRARAVSNFIHDHRLSRLKPVYLNNTRIFSIYDFGPTTRMRAATFSTKEPETLNWISSMSKNDKLIDIGANIGIYSLFAASLGINTLAIEPDPLNFALLTLNTSLNEFSSFLTPYSLALHNTNLFSKLNSERLEWGGALNSFDNQLDNWGNPYLPSFSHGVYGCTLDSLLSQVDFFPTHIKIDVDGNELLILKGSSATLKNPLLKSLLIELDENRHDYHESIHLLHNLGFQLTEKSHAPQYDTGRFSSIYNHIFYRIL